MKFGFAGAAAFAVLCLASVPDVLPGQSTSQPASNSAVQPAPPATTPTATESSHKGQVIFSRSTDENGETVTQTGPSVTRPDIKNVSEPAAEDADRRAVTFTDIDLDVHLRTAEQQFAARASLTVRNDGKTPLSRIPLQISSSLNWERIRTGDRDVVFTVATLNSDTDHTGQLHEAAIPLSQPLAPGATIKLDVTYSGAIALDAKRLLAIGTPDDAALHSDWDQISVPFTGLRGFGNVVWYPVSSVPVILGDGSRVFDEIGREKLLLVGAHFHLRLAIEFPPAQAPSAAIVNGQSVPLSVTDSAAGSEVPGLATADSGAVTLGFEAPSLFAVTRTAHGDENLNLLLLPEDATAEDSWRAAATAVMPFMKNWLGASPHSPLTILDLPDTHDAPFETGGLLAVPVRSGSPYELQGVLVHALSHAFVHSVAAPPPEWLDEGLANFLGTLWTEKHEGRGTALESLEAARPALALAEPESPGQGAGEPLGRAASPVYYRTKATYVLWMLRDIAGETALSAALREYQTGSKSGSGKEAPKSFEKLLEQAGDEHDLAWFFADWIDADKGLPELSIESVFPTTANSDSSLVAVNMVNNGYAAAEVPLTVRSDLTAVTQRILIPARGKASRRVLIQGKPLEVQLNDGAVPETQASVHVTKLTE